MDADCLRMDPEVFDALRTLKGENYEFIYKNEQVMEPYETVVRPMMERMYRRLYEDLILNQFQSPVYQHHLSHYILGKSYRDEENRVTAGPGRYCGRLHCEHDGRLLHRPVRIPVPRRPIQPESAVYYYF